MIKTAIKKYAPLEVLNRLVGRTKRVFALGTPKSGTTSIAGMFSNKCRADHEPHRPATVDKMYEHFIGKISDAQLQQSYRYRDKQLLLELESNCFLAYRPDLVREAFPDARFIVMVREPLAWLESIFDNNLNFPRSRTPTMTQWHSVFFSGENTSNSKNDELLATLDLHPVRHYLDYWVRTYERCLRSLQGANCMVVGTNQITQRAEEIGDFVGHAVSIAAGSGTHKNRTTTKHNVLGRLNFPQVEESIDKICRPLIDEFSLESLWSRSASAPSHSQ